MSRTCLAFLFFVSNILPLMAQKNLLHKLMKARPEAFQSLLDKPAQYDIQIIYTQVDRDEQGFPHFKQHSFQLDKSSYYYPASMVKMPSHFWPWKKSTNWKSRVWIKIR